MSKTLISIVICSYNTKKMTLSCLDKLKKSIDQLKIPVETIVVENGSDGTGNAIKKKYPWIKIIEPKVNTGFAKGNNLGIKACNKNSKYYLLLNTDSFVKPDTLRNAFNFMETHTGCDALGCRLNFSDGNLQPSAGYLPTPFSVWTWIWGLDLLPIVGKMFKPVHVKDVSFFETDHEVGWVMGAFLFIKSEVVKKIGGFDEKLFMYMEEVEFCKRMKDSGFNVWYTPSFGITHLDKASSKKDSEVFGKIFYTEMIGIVYFLRKHYKSQLYLILPLIRIGLLARIIIFSILGNKIRQQAYFDAIKTI